jgi:hypothetical protein
LAACQRREKAVFIQMITAARMAQFDGKDFKKAMKEIG